MTIEAKSKLKKRYKIRWKLFYGLDEDFVIGSEVIETPAQKVFNDFVDMLAYKSPYAK